MRLLLGGASLIALATASVAQAATEAPALEEVVVTAQKREQSLQDVPLSISVVSARQIEQNHIRDFADVAVLTPGFVSAPNYIGIRNSSIRGVSNNAFGFSEDSSIGVYVNGVHQGRAGSQTSVFYDIERVEVTKGPQATLFGRSSIAGAISVVTRKPVNEFEGQITAGLGELGRMKVSGFVNAPINDDFAFRLAAYSEREDGYIRNLNGGDDLAPTDIRAARASLRFQGDRLDNTLIADVERRRQSGVVYQAVGLPDFTVNTTLRGRDSKSDSDIYDITNELNFDLAEGVTLTSLTGFRQVENAYSEDFDGVPQVIAGPFTQGHKDRIYSQDFRVVYDRGGPVVVGGLSAFYETRRAHSENYISLLAFGPPTPGLVNPALLAPNDFSLAMHETGSFEGENRGWSAYADVTAPVGERLKLTAGIRYNRDHKSFSMMIANPATLPENAKLPYAGAYYLWGFWTSRPIADADDWSNTSVRLAVNYEFTDDLTGYVSWNQGWKAGGFDSFTVNAPAGFRYFLGLDAAAAGAQLRPFAPETSDSFEVGLKGQAWDRRVRFNLTTYAYTFKDLQKSVNQGGRPALTNVGEAKAWGVEGDVAAAVAEGLSLTASFAYNDTEVTKDPIKPNQVGLPLNRAPKWQAALGVDYTRPAPWADGGDITAGAVYTYRDKFRTDDNIDPLVDAANLVNVRVGYVWPGGRYSVTVFADNVFDEFTYNRYSRRTPYGAQVDARSVLGKPRQIGIDLSAKF